MLKHLTCACGHQWAAAAALTLDPGFPLVCPVCEAAATPAPSSVAETRAPESAPPAPLANDPFATVESPPATPPPLPDPNAPRAPAAETAPAPASTAEGSVAPPTLPDLLPATDPQATLTSLAQPEREARTDPLATSDLPSPDGLAPAGLYAWLMPTRNPAQDVAPSPHATAHAEQTQPPAPAPSIQDDYEILGELGRGGMGVVYKARQVKLKRLVALKMVLGSHAGKEHLERFRSEAEAVARLQHPNIVQIYEVGERDGQPFFSLEFVDGGSLAQHIANTPQPPREGAQLMEMLARAIHAAHEKGIVHRDLKPANVLLAQDGTPKITDFGLAKQLGEESAQTRSGAILGTPSYMAPEQADGQTRAIGPCSDIYALGAILYELLTGRAPFRGATVWETLDQVRAQDPVPPARLQPKVPRDLETICLKCLHKEPGKRYASAEALADDLKRFLGGEPIEGRRVRLGERVAKWMRRRPAAAALVGVLVVVSLALPVAAWQFAAQLAERRAVEQKRLEEARAEVHDLLARGQTATGSRDWKQAEVLLDKALEKSEAEPALANLRKDVEAVRNPVKGRLKALATYQRFVRDRDEALFHATLASGENFQTNRQTARARARRALTIVGLSPNGHGALSLRPSFSRQEKAEITTGSYALLLVLAETEARRLPQQTAGEHRERLRQALGLLDRADGLGVRTRAIHLRRARYLTLLGDGTGAAKESAVVRALAAETDLDPLDHFLVGHEFYSQGQLELANQEFRRALQLNAEHFWTHYFLGICCVTSGKPEVAVAHLTICQSQQPKLLWIYLLRGFALGQMEDYAAAETDFDRALALQPSPATRYVLYNNRGVMRVGQKGTRAKGVADLKRAAALRPDQYQAQASLAEAFRLDSQLDEAAKHLDEAIVVAGRQVRAGELRPATLALLHHSRARLHLQRSDREASLRDLAEAARLARDDRPLRSRADADRGRVLHLQGRFDEALAAYDAALKADPERVNVLRRRGEVLLAQRRYREAAAAFDAYLEKRGPPSAAVYRQRGLARGKLGRHAEAIEDYSRSLQAKPRQAEQAPLHLYRGQEYLASNALPLALRDFEEALRLDPNSADACLCCAHVRVKLGDPQKGMAAADRAVKDAPKEPRLWHGAARVYAQAAVQLKAEPGQERNQARLRSRYQERAVVLLRTALSLVPAGQRRAYWRENVKKDAALYPIRRLPGFTRLAARYGS